MNNTSSAKPGANKDIQATAVSAPEEAGLSAEALERFRGYINKSISNQLGDGAVVILARHGKVVMHEAFGHTDLANGRVAKLDDVFLMMSLTKAFTASAILRLIDRGELTFSTRAAEIIPEFGAKGKERITIFHLLTHTSGVWSGFSAPPSHSGADMGNLAQMVAAVSAQPLQHTPGEQVVYGPWAGYVVLGEIIRRLDTRNRSYREIMEEDIFAPLGMVDTTIGAPESLGARRVPVVLREVTEGAAEKKGIESLNVVLDHKSERPSGGSFSTAADVFRFAEMLRNNGRLDGTRLLSPAILKFALQNHTGDMPNRFWDYAKEMRGIPEFSANFGHGVYIRGEGNNFGPLGTTASSSTFGAVGGGSTAFIVDKERDLTFVFLSAGFLEGLNHFKRLSGLADMAIACVDD